MQRNLLRLDVLSKHDQDADEEHKSVESGVVDGAGHLDERSWTGKVDAYRCADVHLGMLFTEDGRSVR